MHGNDMVKYAKLDHNQVIPMNFKELIAKSLRHCRIFSHWDLSQYILRV